MGEGAAARRFAVSDAKIRECKRARLALAQANDSGVFEGYASVFRAIDSGGDVIMPGAFAASLKKRGAKGVKMLWQHQASEPIGVWTDIVEDRRGLKVTGQLDLSVARAREALSLLRSGAVDGLSIGFRTKREQSDKKSGLRKLFEVDLWEISVVTFPMLSEARIESVKRLWVGAPPSIDLLQRKLARLKAHRAAQNFETKLRLLAHALEQRYSPNQPRVPAGSREGGQWTDGAGESGAAEDQYALTVDPNVAGEAGGLIEPAQVSGLVDLLEEQGGKHGGHAYSDHVNKTDSFLEARIRSTIAGNRFFGEGDIKAGTFTSLASANKLVNSTLAQNKSIVDSVARGSITVKAFVSAWFASSTGREAIAFRPWDVSAPITFRDTFGVGVVIIHNKDAAKGFRW